MMIPGAPAFAAALGIMAQVTEGIEPLPADPPIDGVVWTVLIPTLLFVGSFLGTYLLYKRFSKEGEEA